MSEVRHHRLAPKLVMVGLGPTIQPSAMFGAFGRLDPRDKPEDDIGLVPLAPDD